MLIFYSDDLTVTGFQTYPPESPLPHIVADDSLAAELGQYIGKLTLVGNAGAYALPADWRTQGAAAKAADDLAAAYADAKRRINAAYEAHINAILADYPLSETLSFEKQEKEARAWQADNAAATPYIDALLVERPLSKYELVARIINKADAFTWASGMATGKRQRLEDEINTAYGAGDTAALDAIQWGAA